MGMLVVKTGVESSTTIDKLGVFIDDVIGDKVYIKISKPDFQHILILHEYEFKKLFKQYARFLKLKAKDRRNER